MSPLLVKICKDFATIWTTIDPIGNVAIFAGLTASLSRAERHRTALRATLYATVILAVAVTAGQIILDAIGILSDEVSQCANPKHSYEFLQEYSAAPLPFLVAEETALADNLGNLRRHHLVPGFVAAGDAFEHVP